MASKIASEDFDEEFLTCEVCLMLFRDPKILPCLHTFCRECLKGWANLATTKQQQLKCPTCRVSVRLPDQGVDGLRTNFYVNKLLDFVVAAKEDKKVEKGAEPNNNKDVEASKPRDSCTSVVHHTVKFPPSKGPKVTTEEPLKAAQEGTKPSVPCERGVVVHRTPVPPPKGPKVTTQEPLKAEGSTEQSVLSERDVVVHRTSVPPPKGRQVTIQEPQKAEGGTKPSVLCERDVVVHRTSVPPPKGPKVTTEEPLKAAQVTSKVSDIAAKLWALDHNRLRRGIEYDVNPYSGDLFSFVKWHKFEWIPTYKAFLKLLHNYDEDGDFEEEDVTEKEQNDARAFLNRCLDTKVMEEAHAFLAKEGCVPESRNGFKYMLYNLWFTPYARSYDDWGDGSDWSTAFEHTFVGETRCGNMIGCFQNWLQLCNDEQSGNIQHKGASCCDCDGRIILTVDLDWKGPTEIFVGTSPEFELALYTVCFLAGDGLQTEVILGGQTVTINTHKWKGHLASCYPTVQQLRSNFSCSRQRDWSDTDTESESEDDSYDRQLAEGLDFMQYLQEQGYSPEMKKRKLKWIYENDYTHLCGRREGTAFSQVLYTLKMDGRAEVYTDYFGVEVVAFL
ncbi:uncharacterized protein LOC144911632 isoform X2 [Branchiostoma floridae x Branchiostoma belcheri]